jgi:spermidine/putrescine transport system permease protein
VCSRWPASEKQLLLFPPGLWLFFFFVLPLAIVIFFSLCPQDIHGGVLPGFTLEHYRRIADPLYVGIFVQSLKVAAITTMFTLLLAYPTAYCMAFSPKRTKMLLMFLVILPFGTNFLVRMYSFVNILGADGVINTVLLRLGIIREPLDLIYNMLAVYIGFVYGNLPYMILPIFAALDRMDVSLLEASMDLGAGPVRTFCRITLPYSMPGVAAGIVFVFIPTLGNFVVPEILGGADDILIGNVISRQFLSSRNWPFGSALSATLVFGLMILITMYIRFCDPMGKKRLATM